ncbi:hypothetical protein FQB29_004649 [Saccharomyces cerevisiae]|uniref:K7_02212p n=1 Tax=Saccharomyces cerevisiae (strain Kyokai no. 7 / NBRC 101557) TaxID=721032 RepID=G2WD82_YEASK|nr:ALH_1c_G0016780.mRNA.1.CDS.1 [Saccharomyces cerevisiae]GAA23025.1 K7_02212p [Saccharomyces cerevisiae Kyokai no. 7]CAI4453886.1 ALH_1b_G0016800.mRNA.1.CDS.1 [Saccharomyces cerevisiae]CAI4454646.1 CEL_1a_G0016870.mRNA.1.CDS.1 [Saccharomyces cerevisiae]CAI5271125.1 CLL_HP2_G0014580.mRNA.1.CDS.1 [Saccharomyces cerevisiae]
MSQADLCRIYLQALNEGNLENVLSLFVPGAVVSSPLYGIKSVEDFYRELFDDTNQSTTTLLNVFSSNAKTVALHFHYKWRMKNEEVVNFECVDVFKLNSDGNKFEKITIIYDTHPLRAAFDDVKMS